MIRRYEFALYPTKEQHELLLAQAAMMADLWNALLQRHEDIYRRTRGQKGVVHCQHWVSQREVDGKQFVVEPNENGKPRGYTFYDMTNEITWLRQCNDEWRELSVWSSHRVARSLVAAFDGFYRGGGYPRFKKRSLARSIPHICKSGCRVSPTTERKRTQNWTVTLKGIPSAIHARGRLPVTANKWTDADVRFRDGKWTISVCVELPARRVIGNAVTSIRIDGIDCLANIDGEKVTPAELSECESLQEGLDGLKSQCDKEADIDTRADLKERITRLSARIARKRRNALHVWSSRIVRASSEISIVAPQIKENTKTPHGDVRQWGANTKPVSKLNRRVLSLAPASAIAMLKYKGEESGIPVTVKEDGAPELAVGEKLVAAGKSLRKLKRAIRKETQ